MKEKGILIIAAGHPHYGQMALNLCLSLKYTCPDIPVVLCHYGDAVSRIDPFSYMFDDMIAIPDHMVQVGGGGTNFVKPKVYAYQLSPFEHTMVIDADVLWFPHRGADALFQQLRDIDITIANRGKVDLSSAKPEEVSWASPKEVIFALDHDGEFYNLASEFMYFRKCEAAENLFKLAQNFYEAPGINYKRFAGGVPDELAFQMAYVILNERPHQSPFVPFYWEHHYKKMARPKELYAAWWGYSMGGNISGDHAKSIYNNLAQWYYNHFGLKFQSPIRQKRDILPERKHI